MSKMAKHPWLAKRGTTFYIRAPVPKDIAATFGKAEVTYSLRTKDARDARRLIDIEAKKISDQFEAHRQGREPTPATPLAVPLDGTTLSRLGDEFYQHIIDEEYAWRADLRANVVSDQAAFLRGDFIAHPRSEWYNTFFDQMDIDEMFLCCIEAVQNRRLCDVANMYALADISGHFAEAAKMASQRGLTLSTADHRRLARRLLEAEIEARKAIIRKDATGYQAILTKYGVGGQSATAVPVPAHSDPGPKLQTLVEGFLAEGKMEGLATKTTLGDATDLREFVQIVGDKPIRAYSKTDGIKFKETLFACPAQRKVAPFKDLNIAEAAAKAELVDPDRKTIPRLHRDTINDKIDVLTKFFVWANGHHGSVANPVDGLRIKVKSHRGKKSNRGLPFNTDELVKLFNGPIYRGCDSTRSWKAPGALVPRHSARFWAPLIALYSGMRMGEIIQLRVADIKTDGQGITYFDVTTSLEEDDDEADKSLKTLTSQRQIPVHPFLLSCGLIGLVAQRKKEGSARLWLDYDRSPTDGSWSKTFSAWFRHYRKHVGVERIIRGKNRVDFHSFRHLYEDVVRDLPGVKQEVRDALQGHGENGVSANYGTGVYRARLNDAMQLVRCDGLDLSHLLP